MRLILTDPQMGLVAGIGLILNNFVYNKTLVPKRYLMKSIYSTISIKRGFTFF